jgi:peptide/nickel transport system substrate-binding protein
VVNGQLLAPSILGHNPSLEPYPYDPDQAKQLIEDAGVAGQTITLVGESSGRWLNDRELVEAVASYWTDAGLTVDLQSPEFGAYLDVLFDREKPSGRDLRVELERHPRSVATAQHVLRQ